jgi:hypothetical protein
MRAEVVEETALLGSRENPCRVNLVRGFGMK